MKLTALLVLCCAAFGSSFAQFANCLNKPGAYCDYNCKSGYFEDPTLLCGLITGRKCCSPAVTIPSSMTTIVPPLNICGVSKYGTEAGKTTPQPTDRIVGGEEAYPNEFPWLVTIQLDGEHICGGSIIARSWILTAAHCFEGLNLLSTTTLSKLRVVAGEHRLLNSDSTEVYSKVSKVIPANWNKWTNANDIALVKLSDPLNFNSDIREVCFADTNIGTLPLNFTVASGWGATKEGAFFSPNTLVKVQLRTMANSECDGKIKAAGGGSIDQTMLCASGNAKDTCQGDSGGPLIMRKTQNGQEFVQVGVVSWGIGCASGTPGVYSRVSYFYTWINSVMAGN